MYSFYQPISDPNLPENVSQEYMEPRDIRGKQFEEFLDLCFNYASYFSLSRAAWEFCVDKNLERELEPFKVKTVKTLRWFCYDRRIPMRLWFRFYLRRSKRIMKISVYQATSEAKAILLKHYSKLFLFAENCTHINSAPTLEDLCFFTREKLFVGTVSHEYICYVYPPDETFEKELSRFGRWVYQEDSVNDQILLAEYM